MPDRCPKCGDQEGAFIRWVKKGLVWKWQVTCYACGKVTEGFEGSTDE